MNKQDLSVIKKSFYFLLETEEIKKQIILSTLNPYVHLEIFPGGGHRYLPYGTLGNLYNSPGLIIALPTLGDDEYDEDEDLVYFDNCLEWLKDYFEEIYAENLEFLS